MKKLFIGLVSAVLLSPCTALAQAEAEYDSGSFNAPSDSDMLQYIGESDNAELYDSETAWDGVSVSEVIPDGNTYHITNAAQLAYIAEQVNKTGSDGMYGKIISIEADIDLGGFEWVPIGCYYDRPFAGTFNGNGHTISNLKFDASSFSDAGLFGSVLGSINDIAVITAEEGGIDTYSPVIPSGGQSQNRGIGILAGCIDERGFEYQGGRILSGSISNCSVSGSLTVTNGTKGQPYYVGGIAGKIGAGADVKICSSQASVTSISENHNGADEAYIGAVAGGNLGTIEGCSAGEECLVSVKSSNPSIGGICGANYGIIKASTSKADFSFEKLSSSYDNYINIGGIAGISSGTIDDCVYNKELNIHSDVSDSSAYLNFGGIAGLNEYSIYNCRTDGSVRTDAAAVNNIGGIAGLSKPYEDCPEVCSISASHGAMSISAENAAAQVNAGGIAGASYSVIDSCMASPGEDSSEISVITYSDLTSNIGAVAGISYNTISDCTVPSRLIIANGPVSDDLPTRSIYGGGITGVSYGDIFSCQSSAYISLAGTNSLAGGICAKSAYDSGKTVINPGETEKTSVSINGCVSSANASSANSGGICADASLSEISECISRGTVAGAASAAGITASASNIKISDCIVSASISPSGGNVFGIASSLSGNTERNVISNVYLAPKFDDENTASITVPEDAPCAVSFCFFSEDALGAAGDPFAIGISGDLLADPQSYTNENGGFDFDKTWTIENGAPMLQTESESYSNSSAYLAEQNATRLTFKVKLDNPIVGERVYIALFDKNGRFTGAVSGTCVSDENSKTSESDIVINYTNTKAEADFIYKYSYWDLSTWEKAEDVPVSCRIFTWDADGSMKAVSSVCEITEIPYDETLM